MPFFDFSKPVSKKKSTKECKPKSIWITLEKNVQAVVDINDDLLYLAVFEDGKQVLIHKNSYKCKGHKTIYSQILHGKYKQRLIISRIPDNCCNHRPYLPFAVGCIIIGDIICRTDTLMSYFKVKKCYIDYDNAFATAITKTFKSIYTNELEQRIIEHYSNFDYDDI